MEVNRLIFLLFLFGSLLALGLYFLLAGLFNLPTIGAAKAILNMGRHDKKPAKNLETLLFICAAKFSKLIRMDEYKRNQMSNTLKAAGFAITPEVYTAQALVKAGAILLGLIPCLFLIPLLSPALVFLAVMVYFREIKRADEKLKAKHEEIESELPRFVATVEQELKSSRDVLSIIENFRKNAGKAFSSELGILTADMRSSGYEAALTRFEARLNSPEVSDVARGLISVLRGDD
jgi:flagellar protein FlaJ